MTFFVGAAALALHAAAPTAMPRHSAPCLAMPPPPPPRAVWLQQAGAMWLCAAALGPVCDGRHSAHDVLHYAADSIAGPPWLLFATGGGGSGGGAPLLETCWWVPLAFGGAGVVVGAAHPALDRAWEGAPRPPPGWPAVLLSIGCFVGCYELSGVLAQPAADAGGPHDYAALDAPLALAAALQFVAFERSRGGLLMMAALFLIGPPVEVFLINSLHLYAYTHPDLYGIPTWIAWVYAAGGPANGALGRQLLYELDARRGGNDS